MIHTLIGQQADNFIQPQQRSFIMDTPEPLAAVCAGTNDLTVDDTADAGILFYPLCVLDGHTYRFRQRFGAKGQAAEQLVVIVQVSD